MTAEEIEIHCEAKECKEIVRTRTRVLSSHIYAVGRWGSKTEVTFMDYKTKGPGPSAEYHGVPIDLHERLMKSSSKGEFFHAEIEGKFDWNYIPGENFGKSTKRHRV